MAGFAEWAGIGGVDEVLDVYGSVEGEGDAMACHAGGHDTVKHVHSTGNHFQDLWRSAESHRIPGFVGGEEWDRVFDGSEHFFLGFSD